MNYKHALPKEKWDMIEDFLRCVKFASEKASDAGIELDLDRVMAIWRPIKYPKQHLTDAQRERERVRSAKRRAKNVSRAL